MNASRWPRDLERAVGMLHRLEDGILALLLGAMIGLAALQIGLRDAFGSGLSWADPLLRVMVLWLGLLGALAASRERKHITIDVLSRSLPKRAKAGASALTGLFTASVCGVVAWHAGRLVAQELEFGGTGIGFVPSWLLVSVIPLVFGCMTLRHLLLCVADLRGMTSPGTRES